MNSLDIKSTPIIPAEYRYAHVKRDGIQIEFVRNRDRNALRYGRWSAWTRTPTNFTEHLQQVPSARRVFIIGNSGANAVPFNRLQGELYWPGHEAKDVKSAIAEGRYSELMFEVHWIDIESNKDCQLLACMQEPNELKGMHYICMHYGLTFTPFLDLHNTLQGTYRPTEQSAHGTGLGRDAVRQVNILKHHAPGTLPTNLLLSYRDPDSDGWVLKDHAHADKNWLKLKPYNTCELELIGYTDGKGKYVGQIGALVLTGGVKCSGMDDATRAMFSKDRFKYLGMRVEVAYEKVIRGTNGLRHPRFIKLRDDLPV